jgi:hypothetical protein
VSTITSGLPRGEEAVEHLRGEAVALDEVAVQVQVPAVAAKAERLGAELVHARGALPVHAAVDVVDRNEQEHRVAQRRQPVGLRAEVAHQRHAGVDALGLAGVDAVVVEEHGRPCCRSTSRSNTPSAVTTPACIGTPVSDTPIWRHCSTPGKRSASRS